MTARARKAIGGAGLVAYLLAYIVAAVTLADTIPFNPLAQLIYFVVAGVAWVAPLKPALAWMMRPDPAPDARSSL